MTKEEIIEKMVMEVLDNFDFQRVHDVIKHIGWRWRMENGELAVPSMYRLMKTADKLLSEVAEYYGDKEIHAVSIGGLQASLNGDRLSLRFVLTSSAVDGEDLTTN